MSTHADMMLHRRPFVKVVAAALRDDCHVEPGDRVLAAVSGGADSVAMLRVMAVLAARKEWSLDLHVAHINHHLRDDADTDETFVADLAASLKLTFHRADVYPADTDGNLEAAARDERYAALLTIADDIHADHIATAHHADDQLETMLMRLIRGASVHGLAGIMSRRRLADRHMLIRPMLGVDHAAVIEFLTSIGQTWHEDSTNADVSRWRARLRADVLPVLRELRPDAAAKAVGASRRLHDAGRVFSHNIRRAVSKFTTAHTDGTITIEREAARRMMPEVLRGLIRRVSLDVGASVDGISAGSIERIAETARDDSGELRQFTLTGGVAIDVAADCVRWKRTGQSI